MADDPKPQTPPAPSADSKPADPKAAPATGGDSPTPPPPPATSGTASRLPADALSDGTQPTVLALGESHRPVAKGKATLTAVYRKADILTTLLTFGGAIIAAVIIVGGYAFFTRSQSKPVAAPGKVTTLSQADLDKLGAFFNGNSAGNSAEVLTVSASSLFKNRVAVDSDLKTTGALSVTGPTSLGALTVDQTSTLGVTDIRGGLTVSGPASFQSPVAMVAGANVKGDLAVSGNGSFGGSVSAGVINAATLSVTTINLAGHLSITGAIPSAAPNGAGTSASVSSSSNDTAGTISVDTSATFNAGASLVTLKFHTDYARDPTIIITPVGSTSAVIQPFVLPGAASFTIGAAAGHAGPGNFAFNYWIVQ